MNEPEALLADQILERVRAAMVPTRADAARNFAGIEARLGLSGSGALPARSDAAGAAGPGLGTASSAAQGLGSSAALGAARGLRLSVQLGVLVSFGLATGAIGYLLGRSDSEPRAAVSPVALVQSAAALPAEPRGLAAAADTPAAPPSLESPVVAAPAEPPRAAEPIASGVLGAAARRHPARLAPHAVLQRSSVAPHAQTNTLELSEALELLRRAEAAVRHSDGLEARMWLGDLDRRAPRELLREERLATQVLAACALGDLAEARAALAELEQSNPESMYRARLEGSCATPKR